MEYLLNGIMEALYLLGSFDQEVYAIIGLSIFVSMVSTFIASTIGITSGIAIGLYNFKWKPLVMKTLYSLMALPPVVVGLMTAIILSRRGPMGAWELLYTPTAMILAQTFLITPIVMGIVAQAATARGGQIKEVGIILGADGFQRMKLIFNELRGTMGIAISTGFGRGISEVGAVMIVGGNIKGHTRVMTTFIAMNNAMGNYEKSLAMGLVLIVIAMATNVMIHRNEGD